MPKVFGQDVAAGQATYTALSAAGNRCPHLLSPLRIRNVVLKNRIYHTVSPTYLMQGPENFPTEMYREHMSNMAKNAAIVSMSTHFAAATQRCTEKVSLKDDSAFNHYSDRAWDDIPTVYNYVNEMMDQIHYQGALISFAGNSGMETGCGVPAGMGSSGGVDIAGVPDDSPKSSSSGGRGGGPGGPGGMATQTDDQIVADAKEHEANGYDVYQLRSTSAEAIKRIKAETNLILMGSLGGPGGPGGGENTASSNGNQPTAAQLEQAVAQAKKLEGLIDILWMRIDEHPNAWSQDKGKPKALAYAAAIKKAGIKIITCPSGGFHDPVENDGFIAQGLTDMVGMTTPLFADGEMVRKLKEGRADDVIPCIACEYCHGISMTKPPWYSTCTVNPKWGLPPYQLKSITKSAVSKKVAVIGGGPGGMKAALVAAERGHKVTLYERSDSLGGQLKISDYSQWRWNFKVLKEYLAYQVNKAGIEVQLKTRATPETIKAKGYDTVLVATGAEAVFSELESGGKSDVFNLIDVYTNKKSLGKNVVMIGAGKFGVDAATGMIKDGHKVTLLATGPRLVEPEEEGPHNMRNQGTILAASPDFSFVLNAKVKDFSAGKVTYTDSTGQEKSIQADSVVVWSGLKPRMDDAEKFIGSADDVAFLGDCTGKGGSIQKAIRSAFFVASQV
jgi:thioredoxin reductase